MTAWDALLRTDALLDNEENPLCTLIHLNVNGL